MKRSIGFPAAYRAGYSGAMIASWIAAFALAALPALPLVNAADGSAVKESACPLIGRNADEWREEAGLLRQLVKELENPTGMNTRVAELPDTPESIRIMASLNKAYFSSTSKKLGALATRMENRYGMNSFYFTACSKP